MEIRLLHPPPAFASGSVFLVLSFQSSPELGDPALPYQTHGVQTLPPILRADFSSLPSWRGPLGSSAVRCVPTSVSVASKPLGDVGLGALRPPAPAGCFFQLQSPVRCGPCWPPATLHPLAGAGYTTLAAHWEGDPGMAGFVLSLLHMRAHWEIKIIFPFHRGGN